MRIRALAAAVVAGMAAVACTADDALTLEAIFTDEAFSSPNPSEMTWLPDGEHLLLSLRVDDDELLVVEEARTGKRRRVADWSAVRAELLRQRPGWEEPAMGDVNSASNARFEPAISPDGSMLVGCLAGELYRLDLATGEARFLMETAGSELFPTFSPDGRRLGYVRDGDLWWRDLETGSEHRLTDRGGDETLLNGMADWVAEEELDVERAFWWSPAGDRLAFVQYDASPIEVVPLVDDISLEIERQRYPKAGSANARPRLGVVGLDGGEPTWIADGADPEAYLPRAGWTPDGDGVWYEWLSRDQSDLELRLTDPDTGEDRVVVREHDPAWVNLGDDPVLLGDDRVVWSSERDGWRHLYLYRLDGTLVRRLTSGEWQVEEVYGLDGDRRRLVIQGTRPDPRQRHLFEVPLDGSGARPLTERPGTHAATLSPTGSLYVEEYSALEVPPQLDVVRGDGTFVRALAEGTIPALAEVELQPYELGTVTAADGAELYTCMIRPPGPVPEGGWPALLYVYGGPHAQLVMDEWGGARHLFFQLLARHGMVVFWLDNRGTWGRGHAFETPIHRRLGEIELADQLRGVEHLRSLDFVDGARLGVYGGSYGGFMALTALLEAPDLFRAGIAYAPVTDWRLYDTVYTERYMDLPRENPEGYRETAPVERAGDLRARLLLVHGAMDNNVHLQNSLRLVDRLAAAEIPFELMVYPRVRHPVRTSQFRTHFHRLKLEFLLRWLVSEAPGLD